MLCRYRLIALAPLLIATTALATPKDKQPVPQQAASAMPVLTVPPPDFSPPKRDALAPLADIPSSGSSDQYVHGPNEGPVPGAGAYRLGGPPPNAQGLLDGN
jgi:hypothetical protein